MRLKFYKSLIVLNIVIILMTTLLVVASYYLTNIQLPDDSRTSADFEYALASRVGETYTDELHRKIVELIEDSDQVAVDSVELLQSYGGGIFAPTLVILGASVVSLVLILKSKTLRRE